MPQFDAKEGKAFAHKGIETSPNESLITRINKAIEDVESGVSKKEACKSARVSRFGDSWQPSVFMCMNTLLFCRPTLNRYLKEYAREKEEKENVVHNKRKTKHRVAVV